jgi:hypothetical protein
MLYAVSLGLAILGYDGNEAADPMANFEMRVQLQDHEPGRGKDNTLARAVSAKAEPGVTVEQLCDALDGLLREAPGAKWIGKPYQPEFKKAVARIKQRIRRIPPNGIFKEGANIKPLQQTFRGDGKVVFRVDIESLRGHNLRS